MLLTGRSSGTGLIPLGLTEIVDNRIWSVALQFEHGGENLKNLFTLVVVINLCFSSAITGDSQTRQDRRVPAEYDGVVLGQLLEHARAPMSTSVPQPRFPQSPAPPVFHVSKQGIAMASIGGGLLVLGLALVANSGSAPGILQPEERRNTARLYGGGILAGVGATMLWHGLCKLK